MKRQGGFTLIELVVVIVILGILAVTAAPKFLNLQGDARKSSLQGLKGAMSGASGIVYGKSAINGVEGAISGSVDSIDVAFGYPTATSAGIATAVVGLSDDWTSFPDATTTPKSYVSTFKKDTLSDVSEIRATECFVEYKEGVSGVAPIITVDDDKC